MTDSTEKRPIWFTRRDTQTFEESAMELAVALTRRICRKAGYRCDRTYDGGDMMSFVATKARRLVYVEVRDDTFEGDRFMSVRLLKWRRRKGESQHDAVVAVERAALDSRLVRLGSPAGLWKLLR